MFCPKWQVFPRKQSNLDLMAGIETHLWQSWQETFHFRVCFPFDFISTIHPKQKEKEAEKLRGKGLLKMLL